MLLRIYRLIAFEWNTDHCMRDLTPNPLFIQEAWFDTTLLDLPVVMRSFRPISAHIPATALKWLGLMITIFLGVELLLVCRSFKAGTMYAYPDGTPYSGTRSRPNRFTSLRNVDLCPLSSNRLYLTSENKKYIFIVTSEIQIAVNWEICSKHCPYFEAIIEGLIEVMLVFVPTSSAYPLNGGVLHLN